MERKNAWKSCDEAKLAQVNALCADYIKFISDCKTERECVEESIRLAEAAGYKNLNERLAIRFMLTTWARHLLYL